MINVAEAATRKIGPLPAFAWGGIVGGGVLAWRMLHGGGGGGASSAFVQPVGGPGMDFEGGGGGGAAEGPATTLPPVGGSATGTSGGNGKIVLRLTGLANFWTNPLKTHDKTGTSGSYIVEKVTIGGRNWYKIISAANGGATSRKGWYIPRYSKDPSYYKTTVTTA